MLLVAAMVMVSPLGVGPKGVCIRMVFRTPCCQHKDRFDPRVGSIRGDRVNHAGIHCEVYSVNLSR